MLRKIWDRCLNGLMDSYLWLEDTVGIFGLLMFLALVGMGLWQGWRVFEALHAGAHWTDKIYIGVKNGQSYYWHLWFVAPLSVGLIAGGCGLLFVKDFYLEDDTRLQQALKQIRNRVTGIFRAIQGH